MFSPSKQLPPRNRNEESIQVVLGPSVAVCKHNSRVLLRTKSVCCQVGRDVAACLQEALTRKGLDMRVAALVRKYFHLPTVILSPHHSILTQLGLSIVCFKVTYALMDCVFSSIYLIYL